MEDQNFSKDHDKAYEFDKVTRPTVDMEEYIYTNDPTYVIWFTLKIDTSFDELLFLTYDNRLSSFSWMAGFIFIID